MKIAHPVMTIFILRAIDEPVLRMSIEKVLSGIEHVHAFTRAVSVGNPRKFLQAEKEDQEMAEACKRLIKELHHLLELPVSDAETRRDR
ncbi:MAG: Tn3 family transposase [Verrucomicrobia bacterium]|nr:Tn3 family transposase [Verrucomicrobiota bacterium]